MSRHRLGFAVKVLGGGGLPSHDTRRWQSGPHLRISLGYLTAVLERLDALDIRMYRMATALAPYASHPGKPEFHTQVQECAEELAAVGALARDLNIRLSTHPGQYTVLNSESGAVRDAAIAELEVQATLLDAMGLGREAVVVLHVGGMAGGVEAALGRFERAYERLSDSARSRLVIENDDRSFGLAEVLELHRRIGIRVVWDILHHYCVDRAAIPVAEALALACDTWPQDERPKMHYSSPRLDLDAKGRAPQLRAHADFVDPIGFEAFLLGTVGPVGRDLDVMLEAKAKDLALLRIREELRSARIGWHAGQLVIDDEPPARARAARPGGSADERPAGAPLGAGERPAASPPEPPADGELRAAILGLLAEREPQATICPSEAARLVAGGGSGDRWRQLMPEIRRVADILARERAIEVTQRGAVIDAASARGPIRLRLAGGR